MDIKEFSPYLKLFTFEKHVLVMSILEDGPLTPNEIAAKNDFDMLNPNVCSVLRRLEKNGLVECTYKDGFVRKGKHKLTDKYYRIKNIIEQL